MTEQQGDASPRQDRQERHPISRRLFLKGSSATMAATGIAAASFAAGQSVSAHPAANVAAQASPTAMAGMASTASSEQAASAPVAFFTMHEADTVEALTARILPGTAEDPGAREAGVVNYIDRALAGPNLGYTLKTYIQGPYLVTSETPITVEAASSRDIYSYVLVDQRDVSRYGYQSVLIPQAMYRRGLEAVDAYANSKFQKDFADLSEAQQDQILEDMESGQATGFDAPTGPAFFTQLRNDTIEGMFSDPMYGGNKDMVGWKLIGYPGAQSYYTSQDIKNPNFSRPPQNITQMMIAGDGNRNS